MLKQEDLSEKGLLAFKDCIAVVPSVMIDFVERVAIEGEPDYRIRIRGESYQQNIYLEIKNLGTPKNAREAANSLLRTIRRNPMAYGILAAPYISPASATICREAGIGYVDLSGNCYIAFQQVFISRENMQNRFPFKSGLTSIFAPKSERILRVLLAFPYKTWLAVDLAREAQVSLGMITHVGRKLIEEEWLTKTSQGISLTQPERLLFEWANNYTIKRNDQKSFYALRPLQDVEKDIAEQCIRLNIPYALTGFSACNRLAPMVRGQRAMIYVHHDMEQVAEKTGLKIVESGANIILLQPYDDGVYWNAKPNDDLEIADPVQVYLDLKRYPGRGEEAADFLFREVIKPRWQQLEMNMTGSS